MKIKPFSLIDDDDNDDNISSQTHFSSKLVKFNKNEESHDEKSTNKRSFLSGRSIPIDKSSKKDTSNNNPKINKKHIYDFNSIMIKENTLQKKNNLINNISKIQDKSNSNILNKKIPCSFNNKEKNISHINTNNTEVQKVNKLSKTLINEKKEKKSSYRGKIYFFVAILMIIYQYLSYIFLIELPIIQSK